MRSGKKTAVAATTEQMPLIAASNDDRRCDASGSWNQTDGGLFADGHDARGKSARTGDASAERAAGIHSRSAVAVI